MSEGRGSISDRHQARRYEIRVEGHIDGRWAAWFDGLRIRHEPDGRTVLHGSVVDQAALHGLLHRVRDLGMPLVSVTRVPDDRHHPDADAGATGVVHRGTERNDER